MFSYSSYKKIISLIKESGKYTNFHELKRNLQNLHQFILMRHDVEFSVERAYNLATLEAEEDFYSTYFFQLSNNAYNLLSMKNRILVEKIQNMGHGVGLHFHLNGMADLDEIKMQIKKEVDVMSSFLGFRISCFSIHRPTVDVLRANIKIPGLINTYEDSFFGFTDNIVHNPPQIKYISDSKHQWNYGLEPDREAFARYAKIQILTHPYSWTEKGYDNFNNFRTLIAEKQDEFKETIHRECKHFEEVRERLSPASNVVR